MAGETVIFETFLATASYKTYLHITEYVEKYIDVPTFLLNGETLEDFSAAYADVGFINALSYVQLLHQVPCPIELIAAPVLKGEPDPEDLSAFFSIVVHKDSTLTTIDDLARSTWAYHAGAHHVEDRFLYEQGTAVLDFKNTIETSSQAQSLRLVLDGKADATAIDVRMLDIAFHNSPRMATQLRILDTCNYSSSPLIVVATHMNPFLKKRIQEVFLKIHQHSLLAQQLQEEQIERFIAMTNADYQHLRANYWQQPTATSQRLIQNK